MSQPHTHNPVLDVGAVLVILGSFAGVLPYVAAGLAAFWYCVLIFDRFKNKKTGRDSP